MSNFIEITPQRKLGEISRYETVRFIDVRADLAAGVNANEKIAEIEAYLQDNPLPFGVDYLFRGDQEEQAESQAFLQSAMIGALGLMFAILLAQFNSVYNSVLVLSAVVMSATGVLLGMMVMQQPFSIIMTGTGVVALAGIVVNNNIVLIDTYREFVEEHPRIEGDHSNGRATHPARSVDNNHDHGRPCANDVRDVHRFWCHTGGCRRGCLQPGCCQQKRGAPYSRQLHW